ncbi:unnamed protein product [Camellia sinensis]
METMDPRKCRKLDDDVVAIIQRYNEKTKAFTIGKKNLTFTTNDVTLIFGLEGGQGAMSLRYSKKSNTPFLKRRLPKETRLTGLVLKKALVKTMKGKQPHDFKDVAIIVILYLCLTLFFATSGNSIGWVFIKYVEPLKSMKKYNWPKAITATLIDFITALHKILEKVTGCVIALLVKFLRCAKWNMQSLTKQLQKTPIKSLAPRQKNEGIKKEKATKKNKKQAMEKKDQASNAEKEAIEENEELEDKEEYEGKEEKDNEEEDEGIESKKEEQNNEEMDEEENNEQVNQRHDSICGSIMQQPQESKESKDAQIANLHERLKALSKSKIEEEKN